MTLFVTQEQEQELGILGVGFLWKKVPRTNICVKCSNLETKLHYMLNTQKRDSLLLQEAFSNSCVSQFLIIKKIDLPSNDLNSTQSGKVSTPGWQGLAGFRAPQQNPSDLSKSAYLQIFATKMSFFYDWALAGLWLAGLEWIVGR